MPLSCSAWLGTQPDGLPRPTTSSDSCWRHWKKHRTIPAPWRLCGASSTALVPDSADTTAACGGRRLRWPRPRPWWAGSRAARSSVHRPSRPPAVLTPAGGACPAAALAVVPLGDASVVELNSVRAVELDLAVKGPDAVLRDHEKADGMTARFDPQIRSPDTARRIPPSTTPDTPPLCCSHGERHPPAVEARRTDMSRSHRTPWWCRPRRATCGIQARSPPSDGTRRGDERGRVFFPLYTVSQIVAPSGRSSARAGPPAGAEARAAWAAAARPRVGQPGLQVAFCRSLSARSRPLSIEEDARPAAENQQPYQGNQRQP